MSSIFDKKDPSGRRKLQILATTNPKITQQRSLNAFSGLTRGNRLATDLSNDLISVVKEVMSEEKIP
ncbi:MAG: hypothetical protein DCF15_15775 [Phormidesmis priestleyi]|uniref:Uncharacterized protein n=1 Tax=Phormidesmis priestleyi TaxID=268141 RepID=A0A2W4WZB1_9CYAN|nr:MAG: hypothetical protein DCF15_15775 [Phormidesmis priestleyi]